jgi:hypothetical protein
VFSLEVKVMFEFIFEILYMWSLDGLLCGLRYVTQPWDPDEGKANWHSPVGDLLLVKLVQVGQVDDACVGET